MSIMTKYKSSNDSCHPWPLELRTRSICGLSRPS